MSVEGTQPSADGADNSAAINLPGGISLQPGEIKECKIDSERVAVDKNAEATLIGEVRCLISDIRDILPLQPPLYLQKSYCRGSRLAGYYETNCFVVIGEEAASKISFGNGQKLTFRYSGRRGWIYENSGQTAEKSDVIVIDEPALKLTLRATAYILLRNGDVYMLDEDDSTLKLRDAPDIIGEMLGREKFELWAHHSHNEPIDLEAKHKELIQIRYPSRECLRVTTRQGVSYSFFDGEEGLDIKRKLEDIQTLWQDRAVLQQLNP
ncbi:MAG: hypothetical protein FWG48_06570 [Oscillospiraceae bacterium]|nr:hypothetical protein [Oscillospiraceae bacterium]